MAERLYKYDNLKALLIYLVVLGHMIRPTGGGGSIGVFLYVLIYMFHMPAFLYILGRFAKPSLRKISFFAILYVVFQILYFAFYRIVLEKEIEFSLIEPAYSLWYLLTVIAYLGLAYLFPKEITLKKKLLILGVSLLVSLGVGYCSFVGEPLSLSRTIVFLPFFLAGRYGLFDEVHKKNRCWYTVLSGCISLVLTLTYIFISSCSDIGLQNKVCYAVSNTTVWDRLIALSAAFFFISFLLCIVPNKKIPIISSIGQNTLFIFLGHGLVIKLLVELYTPQNLFLFILCMSVLIVLSLWGCSVFLHIFKRKLRREGE